MGDTPIICPRCGARLSAPGETCAACLFRAASGEDADRTATWVAEARTSPAQTSHEQYAPSDLPETVGPYRIVGLLGEGGMGLVYLAEQTEPIRRRVALKVIKLGMDTRQVVARFDAERHALGLMEHPNIARVIDAGVAPDGRPYFVMEYVQGVPITEYCDAHRLTMRARLGLVMEVCGAVQHAHQKGVIHRDLKPSNVLVGEQDGLPVPKIIDFGIAKATQQALSERTLTELGQHVGTPEYMSPEQVGSDVLDVDVTTDIYSLGVMLYELLVGALPFDPANLRRAGYEEMRRIIREQEPPKPSTRINGSTSSNVASCRQTDLGSLRRQLAGDLDWITLKAIEKDRTRRYASASELSADIARYLNDEAVLASPPSATYRAKKFIRRNRLAVIAVSLIVFAVLAGLVASVDQYLKKTRALRTAVAAGEQALRAEAAARREKAAAETAAAREATARKLADDKTQVASDALESAETNLYFNNINLIEKELAGRNLVRVDELLAGTPPRLRNWEWNYLSRVAHMEDMAFTPFRGGLFAFGTDRSGEHFFAASNVEGVRIAIGDLASGRVRRTVRLNALDHSHVGTRFNLPGFMAAFSPDGRQFAASYLSNGGSESAVWDVNSGARQYSLPSPLPTQFAWSPDGTQLITSQAGSPIIVRDARTGAQQTSFGPYSAASSLAFSPDASKVAVGLLGTATTPRRLSVAILDAKTGDELFEFRTASPSWWLQWSPDGRYVAGLVGEHVVQVWDTINGSELWSVTKAMPDWSPRPLTPVPGITRGLAFSSDGKCLVTVAPDNTLSVLDALSGKELKRFIGAVRPIRGLFALPGGTRVASIEDGVIRMWDLAPGITARLDLGFLQSPTRDIELADIAISVDQRIVASLSTSSLLQVFDAASGMRRLGWVPPRPEIDAGNWAFDAGPRVAFNRDATQVIAAMATNTTVGDGTQQRDHDQRIFDVKTGRELATLKFSAGHIGRGRAAPDDQLSGIAVSSPALDPTGMWAVVATNKLVPSRSNSSLLMQYTGSLIDFWDVARRKATRVTLPASRVAGLSISPDGQRVAVRVHRPIEPLLFQQHIYDVRSGQLMKILSGAPSPAFANDGIRLAAQSDIRTVTVWDSRSWRPLLAVSCSPNPSAFSFSPDDARLAVMSRDGSVTVFETGNGQQVITLQESSSTLRELLLAGYAPGEFTHTVSFSADGTKIAATTLARDENGAVIQIRTWDGTPVRSLGKK